MRPFDTLVGWADIHHPQWLDYLRMLTGAVLLAKGLSFVLDSDTMQRILHDNGFGFLPVLFMHYVVIFQLAHSVLLMLGLLTRIAALAQLPIVLGACYALLVRPEFSAYQSDLWLALLMLFLLVIFAVTGGGRASVDHHIRLARAG